jgi:GAF domain-containing protein/methyl-accepting chemotaxis protein
MNQTDVALQIIIPLVGILELLLAISAWLLDWHIRSNRRLAGLLVLFSLNTLAFGQLAAAADITQAQLWLYILSATTMAVGPFIFITTLSLLRPEVWSQQVWERWLWRFAHLLAFLPAVLTFSDVLLKTRWLYTGLNSQVYAGGFISARSYLQGALAPLLRVSNQYVLSSAPLLLILHCLWRDRQATPLIRRRARWLLAAQLAALAFEMGLRHQIGVVLAFTLTALVYSGVYTIMLLRGMLSDAMLKRWLADVRLRPKLYAGLSASIVGLLVIGGASIYSSMSTLQLVSYDLTRQRDLADRAARISANLLTLQNDTFEFYNTWTLHGFERTVTETGFEFAQSKYLDPIQERLQEVRDNIDTIKRLKPDEKTQTSMDSILENVNDYETSLLEMSSRMESLGADTTGEMSEIQTIRADLLSRLDEVGTESMRSILFQIGQYEKDFFLRTKLSSSRIALELVKQLVQQINEADDTQITPAEKTELVTSLEHYEDHFYTAMSHQRNLQEIRTKLTGQSGQASVQIRDLFVNQQTAFDTTVQRLERQQFSATIAVVSLGLMALFVSSAIAYFITGQIIQPVQALGETAGQLGAGELAIRANVHGQDEIGATATAFNFMADRLQEVLSGLEQQVAERTRDLERRSAYLQASAEVGRFTTSILEPDELIRQAVEFIREQFGLYYVGLFLLDETKKWAVLRAGTGQAGQTMLARGHRIAVGAGMIGWSIANAQARIALDVQSTGADAVRLATAELPDTRSEAAIPLRSRGQVLGALTVQHTEPNAFDPGILAALQTMADQVAATLDNARLFTESQVALTAVRRTYADLSQQAWSEMLRAQSSLGFRSDEHSVTPAAEAWRPTTEQALRQGQIVHDQTLSDSQDNGAETEIAHAVAVPIKMHGQVIGVLDTYKPGERGDWTPEEMALLQEISNQLALALDNARLHQNTRLHAAREQLAAEITTRIRETLEVETVLKTAVEEIYEALGLDELVIYLSPENETDSQRANHKPS